jgi:excisionase family DNA binding protein
MESNKNFSISQQLTLSVRDAASLTHLGLTSMWKLVSDGEIPSFKVGRRRMISRKALVEWIEIRESKALEGQHGQRE